MILARKVGKVKGKNQDPVFLFTLLVSTPSDASEKLAIPGCSYPYGFSGVTNVGCHTSSVGVGQSITTLTSHFWSEALS